MPEIKVAVQADCKPELRVEGLSAIFVGSED
jgi:hypothetical protein